ncbi:MAG: tetratricopeptide repeat protein [Nitrosomonadales bacterium]
MQTVVALLPNDAWSLCTLGVTYQELGRLSEAEAIYRRTLQIKPDFAEVHNNLGNTLAKLGRLDEAEKSYRNALAIKPEYFETHNNLGNTLVNLGRLDESVACYIHALEIAPNFVEAHFNLGNTLWNLGLVANAEASYLKALEIDPDYSDALNNLALLFNVQGKTIMALNAIRQSLRIKETGKAKSIFVTCVRSRPFTAYDIEIGNIMICALTEPWGRPAHMIPAAIDLIKLKLSIAGRISLANHRWTLRLPAHDLFKSNDLVALADEPLLCAVLESAPICDVAMERFLTLARYSLLEAACQALQTDNEVCVALNFYSALARQCFINEYVFSYGGEEFKKRSICEMR